MLDLPEPWQAVKHAEQALRSGGILLAYTPSIVQATQLREALAANTIGGRAGEESRWRAMSDEVRQAQSSWSRLGPVPGPAGRELAERFHKACNRFFDQYRRRVPQSTGPRSGRPVGAR